MASSDTTTPETGSTTPPAPVGASDASTSTGAVPAPAPTAGAPAPAPDAPAPAPTAGTPAPAPAPDAPLPAPAVEPSVAPVTDAAEPGIFGKFTSAVKSNNFNPFKEGLTGTQRGVAFLRVGGVTAGAGMTLDAVFRSKTRDGEDRSGVGRVIEGALGLGAVAGSLAFRR